jgi:hypothetical protein
MKTLRRLHVVSMVYTGFSTVQPTLGGPGEVIYKLREAD